MKILNMAIAIVFGSSLLTACSSMNDDRGSSRVSSMSSQGNRRGISSELLNRYTTGWPMTSQQVARTTIEKYGQPTESTPSMLVWKNISAFKRIVIYREEVNHKFPMLHKDVIEHVVDYKVPFNRVEELVKFDGSIIYNRTAGELSARGDNEAMNFIALNLANDIITNKRQAEEARIEFGRLAVDHMNGNQNVYTQSLQFGKQINTADTDESSKINWATGPVQAQESNELQSMPRRSQNFPRQVPQQYRKKTLQEAEDELTE
jgi:hypothetical protein